jgi:calcium-dependent protein kinase
MKERICEGDYEFPIKDWSNISNDAKNLIKCMLDPCPHRRITINDVLNNKWLLKYHLIKQDDSKLTPTTTRIQTLLDENKLKMFEHAFEEALSEMRINWDNKIELKELNSVDSLLLKRRREKNKKNKTNKQQQQISL